MLGFYVLIAVLIKNRTNDEINDSFTKYPFYNARANFY